MMKSPGRLPWAYFLCFRFFLVMIRIQTVQSPVQEPVDITHTLTGDAKLPANVCEAALVILPGVIDIHVPFLVSGFHGFTPSG